MTVITFDHNGHTIANPFKSPCGQHDCHPAHDYGFTEVQTGGGCIAWRRGRADGSFILLTDEDGSGLPTGVEDCLIGLYASDDAYGDGDTVAVHDLREQLA